MEYVEVVSEKCKNLEYINVFLENDPAEPDVSDALSRFCDEENGMSEFAPAGINRLVESCPKLKTLVVNEVIERCLDIPKHITVVNEDKHWSVMS